MPSGREGHLSFATMPKTVEEVDQCFHSFCNDPQFSGGLCGQTLEAQFKAFRVARARTVTETPETTRVIEEFATMFGLAA